MSLPLELGASRNHKMQANFGEDRCANDANDSKTTILHSTNSISKAFYKYVKGKTVNLHAIAETITSETLLSHRVACDASQHSPRPGPQRGNGSKIIAGALNLNIKFLPHTPPAPSTDNVPAKQNLFTKSLTAVKDLFGTIGATACLKEATTNSRNEEDRLTKPVLVLGIPRTPQPTPTAKSATSSKFPCPDDKKGAKNSQRFISLASKIQRKKNQVVCRLSKMLMRAKAQKSKDSNSIYITNVDNYKELAPMLLLQIDTTDEFGGRFFIPPFDLPAAQVVKQCGILRLSKKILKRSLSMHVT